MLVARYLRADTTRLTLLYWLYPYCWELISLLSRPEESTGLKLRMTANINISPLPSPPPLTSRDFRLSHVVSPVSKLSTRHRDLLLSYASDPGVTRICAGRYSSGIFCWNLCLDDFLKNGTLWLRNTKYIWKKMKICNEFHFIMLEFEKYFIPFAGWLAMLFLCQDMTLDQRRNLPQSCRQFLFQCV